MFDLGKDVLRYDVSGNDNNRIIRAVVGLEPLVYVLEAGGIQILHGADNGPRIRMTLREYAFKNVIQDFAVWLVVSLTFFVLHNAALFVEAFLGHGAEKVSHAIGFHPQSHVECGIRDVLEIVRTIKICGSVHVGGTDLLERLEVLVIEIFAAVEHQVFEEVCKAGFSHLLILGPNVVPDVDRDDRGLVIFVNDQAQPVVQSEFSEVDIYGVGGEGAQG